MEILEVLKILVYPVLLAFGWAYKQHRAEIRDLQKDQDHIFTELNMMKIENATIKQQLIHITESLNEIKTLMNVLIQRNK